MTNRGMSLASRITRSDVSSLNRMYERKTDGRTQADSWSGTSQEAGTTP
jgi:hypothetical protein